MKEQENLLKDEGKKQVICVTCKKAVEVKLIRYGDGYIAVCPECGKLAHNAASIE